jgi:hypothetical protein
MLADCCWTLITEAPDDYKRRSTRKIFDWLFVKTLLAILVTISSEILITITCISFKICGY